MKSKFLIFVFALLSYTFVNGQTTYKEISEQAKSLTEQMVSKLDLTVDQQELIFRQNYVWLDVKLKFDQLTTATDTQLQYLKESKENYIKNVDALLTAEQRGEFKKWLNDSKPLD